jgi:divalent metal cation (Fe/Co/Zn/Cd) transporter
MAVPIPISSAGRTDSMQPELKKRALLLEYVTVGYNLAEAAASLIAGALASSIALTGFGLDSIMESLSGAVLIWRLRTASGPGEKRIESLAVRFVGATFWILALFVSIEAVLRITGGKTADASPLGIVIAAISCVAMPVLGTLKRRLGKRMGLRSLVADAKETFVCFALSAALLTGLICRAVFGFRLADPIAGLVIAAFLFREGAELIFENDKE